MLPHNPGGNYGYTCLSLTTQTFRYGGCSWPIHRNRTPEPYRASAWDESGVFCVEKKIADDKWQTSDAWILPADSVILSASEESWYVESMNLCC